MSNWTEDDDRAVVRAIDDASAAALATKKAIQAAIDIATQQGRPSKAIEDLTADLNYVEPLIDSDSGYYSALGEMGFEPDEIERLIEQTSPAS